MYKANMGGYFLVLRKVLFLSHCVVVWVLFLVLCLLFLVISDRNIGKHGKEVYQERARGRESVVD